MAKYLLKDNLPDLEFNLSNIVYYNDLNILNNNYNDLDFEDNSNIFNFSNDLKDIIIKINNERTNINNTYFDLYNDNKYDFYKQLLNYNYIYEVYGVKIFNKHIK